MKNNACKTPCSDCPFRKNSLPGWLSDYTPVELHQIVMNEMPFPCHMTHQGKDLSWQETGSNEHPFCMGALQYMKKNAKMPRDPRIAKLVSKIKKEDCDNILSYPEFIKHHSKKA